MAISETALKGIDKGEVHIWSSSLEKIEDEELLNVYRSFVSDSERKRAISFHFPKDKRRYLVTRVLARLTLSRYLCEDPQSLHFEKSEYGKPLLVQADQQEVRFNISHTGPFVLLAISRGGRLGIDAEQLIDRADLAQIAESVFAPEEVSDLRRLSSATFVRRFYEYWTLKEAYSKACGFGLSMPLNQAHFRFPGNSALEYKLIANHNDQLTHWKFWSFALAIDCIVALCAHKSVTGYQRPILMDTIPFRSEQVINCKVVRMSV